MRMTSHDAARILVAAEHERGPRSGKRMLGVAYGCALLAIGR